MCLISNGSFYSLILLRLVSFVMLIQFSIHVKHLFIGPFSMSFAFGDSLFRSFVSIIYPFTSSSSIHTSFSFTPSIHFFLSIHWSTYYLFSLLLLSLSILIFHVIHTFKKIHSMHSLIYSSIHLTTPKRFEIPGLWHILRRPDLT